MNSIKSNAGQNDGKMKDSNSKDGHKRRDFIKTFAGATLSTSLGISAFSCAEDKSAIKDININFNKSYYWKMVTTWPPKFPVLGEACELFAKWVNEMSAGRMEIRVFGGGEIVPALEVFDAVSNGIAELGNGSAYYWSGKIPASQIFAAVPFGMNAAQYNSWISQGGGQALWDELYKPFGLIPVLSGNTGVQMGGWFNKEITEIDDLKGLKMRIPGLGGKVFNKAGGTSVLVAGGEIFTNLERGVIDATEWIGPYHDYLMGFPKIAKYYYYPGWHETGTAFETMINTKALQKLPNDLQHIIKYGLKMMNDWVLAAFDYRNSEYLDKIISEHQCQIKEFPDEVINHLRNNTIEVLEEISESNKDFKMIIEKYTAFHKKISKWSNISERAYFNSLTQF